MLLHMFHHILHGMVHIKVFQNTSVVLPFLVTRTSQGGALERHRGCKEIVPVGGGSQIQSSARILREGKAVISISARLPGISLTAHRSAGQGEEDSMRFRLAERQMLREA